VFLPTLPARLGIPLVQAGIVGIAGITPANVGAVQSRIVRNRSHLRLKAFKFAAPLGNNQRDRLAHLEDHCEMRPCNLPIHRECRVRPIGLDDSFKRGGREDLIEAVKMSRLAQRLGAGVGITAGIRFARLFESGFSLCVGFVLGILDRPGRGLMMKLRAYGLISTRCSRVTRRRRRCRLIDLLLSSGNLTCARPSPRPRGARP
jgi:hypothetical protein